MINAAKKIHFWEKKENRSPFRFRRSVPSIFRRSSHGASIFHYDSDKLIFSCAPRAPCHRYWVVVVDDEKGDDVLYVPFILFTGSVSLRGL